MSSKPKLQRNQIQKLLSAARTINSGEYKSEGTPPFKNSQSFILFSWPTILLISNHLDPWDYSFQVIITLKVWGLKVWNVGEASFNITLGRTNIYFNLTKSDDRASFGGSANNIDTSVLFNIGHTLMSNFNNSTNLFKVNFEHGFEYSWSNSSNLSYVLS